MRRCEHKVSPAVDEVPFADSVRSPKHKHYAASLRGEGVDGGVGESFPSDTGMRFRGVLAHGKRCVEQEHSLRCPAREVAVVGNGSAGLVVDLLEDISQRGRNVDARIHREAETVGLTGTMVRILPDDHHFNLIEGSGVES